VIAPFIQETKPSTRDLYSDNILESISKMESVRDNLDELSDNFTPTEKDKEKTLKILYHINAALTLSESQESEDGLRQEKNWFFWRKRKE